MKAIKGARIIVDNLERSACLLIKDGKISEILDDVPEFFSGETIHFGSEYLISPGICDTHVHINEPGRTEWEGFETATHAAAAGGITTLVDMPLNCIPVTVSAQAFQTKLETIRNKLWVDVGFWGGVTSKNIPDLPDLLKSGVLGVKSFLIDSGIQEFPPVSPEQIEEAMPLLAKAGLPYLFHAELESPLGQNQTLNDYQGFLLSRPKNWENQAVELVIRLAEKHHCKSHIVHLSSAEAITKIENAKQRSVPVTAETCPHYLTMHSDWIQSQEHPTLFKCCPPIRDKDNQNALWKGLTNGAVDFIVSDHSPCTPTLKNLHNKDIQNAWGGISGLQLTLPLIWTECRNRGVSAATLSQWLSERPAAMAGLGHKKGRIKKGYDADLVIWNPNLQFEVNRESLHHRHKESPYLGFNVFGKVHRTYLRGNLIYKNDGNGKGKEFSDKPTGQCLLRNEL